MADTRAEIPDREWFKASEVCEIASVQSYVLRSWELEFPNLGIQRSPGGARVYRRSDVERVLKIRQLVFGEGLTLAGARRRIEGETAGAESDEPGPVDGGTRAQIAAIRRELRTLHEWLSGDRPVREAAPSEAGASVQPALPEIDGGQSGGQSGGPGEGWPPERQTRRRRRKQ